MVDIRTLVMYAMKQWLAMHITDTNVCYSMLTPNMDNIRNHRYVCPKMFKILAIFVHLMHDF